MAITGKTSSAATLYFGPSTTDYVAQTTLAANLSLTILWKEGQFYYVECSSPAQQGYISVSLVTGITGGTPSTYTATYLQRYVYGDGSAMCGPGTSYVTAGSLVYRQSVQFLSGKTSGGYALVEFTETGATRRKRGWFLQTKLTTTPPTPQIYTEGHVFNSDSEKWTVSRIWNGSSSDPGSAGHLGIDIKRLNSNGSQVLGKEVYAIADGTVVSTGYYAANGNFVIIRHSTSVGNAYYSLYFHLASYYNITSVSAGDAIGIMGNTGTQSSVEHLHLGITKQQPDGGTRGYYRENGDSGDNVTFSETGTGYFYYGFDQYKRFYNPTRYFSYGDSLINTNYSGN